MRKNGVVMLVHHGLGDVAMTIPMLRHVDQNAPAKARLTFIVKSELEASLLKFLDWRHKIQIETIGGSGPMRQLHAFAVGLKLRMQGVSQFIAPHGTASIGTASLANLIGAKENILVEGVRNVRGAVRTVNLRPRVHKVDYYLDFAYKANFPPCPNPTMEFLDVNRLRARTAEVLPEWSPEQIWVFFAPGSGEVEKHKRWPISSYKNLAAKLLENDSRIRIGYLGAPGEHELMLLGIPEAARLAQRCHVFSGSTIADSLARLASGACLVTGCNGAAHLAALIDRPIVGLFGPTNPAFTGPWSKRLHVVSQRLACSPCYRFGFITGCGRPICLTDIPVAAVHAVVHKAISGQSAPPVDWRETTAAVGPEMAEVENQWQVAP